VLSNTLFISFGGMNLQWDTIPTDIRGHLEQTLLTRGNDFSLREICDFLVGSLGLNYRWNENKEMRNMVYTQIKRYYGDQNRIPHDAQAIVNILFSFGLMEMKWTNVSKSIRLCF
jgi:hypothetical protein